MSSETDGERTNLAHDLWKILRDEEISDVKIRGNDGTDDVPAVRAILAARSQVFRRMLYGSFSESKSDLVFLDYRGAVLRALVEFCYTDSLSALAAPVKENVRTSVGLIAAAHFLDMHTLGRQGLLMTCHAMEACPSMACVVLDEALSVGEPADSLADMAMHIICLKPDKTLLLENESKEGGIQSIGADAIRKVITSDCFQATELTKLRCLSKWVGFHKGTSISDDKDEQIVEKLAIGRHLLSSIDLKCIDPVKLRDLAEDSGLIDMENLCLAFEAQAQQAASGEDIRRTFQNISGGQFDSLVLIAGAGLPFVNGAYRQDYDPQRPFTVYSRAAKWRDESGAFLIERNRTGWMITFRSEGEKTSPSPPFYTAPLAASHAVPAGGFWTSCSDEGVPAPSFVSEMRANSNNGRGIMPCYIFRDP